MTDDLISRQAAIDVTDAVWSVTGDKNVAKVWDQLKDLPSAQPEQRWIPCSERLPEESGRYLVTNTQWGTYHVDWNIYYVNVEGHCDGWLWEQGCIAWMPLPEPYREERTEE